MRPVLILAVLVCLALPATASAKPLVGIGDNVASSYSDPAMLKLEKLKLARLVISWDWYKNPYDRYVATTWLRAVKKAHMRPMVTFTRRWDRKGKRKIPSVKAYKTSFKKFRKAHKRVRDFSPWNEPNAPEQPFTNKPAAAAKLYNAMRSVCRKCTITAGDVYDNKNMVSWTRRYQRKIKGRPKAWAMHNYKDATRKRGTTRQFLAITRGPVWITETGGLRNRGGLKGQAKAVKRVFTLAQKNKRITRIYFYQWVHRDDRTWDSAFMSASGKKRPAYYALKRGLKKAR